MSKRLAQVISIRDRTLTILRERGYWHKIPGAGNFLEASVDNVTFLHRTPFTVTSDMSHQTKYQAALDSKNLLPYGLDIWAGKKVLNVEWDYDGRVEIVSFRRGEWEQLFVSDDQSARKRMSLRNVR